MNSSAPQVFDEVYKNGIWGKNESDSIGTSGFGSDPKNAKIYINFLQTILSILPIKTILDIGCGDFQIMSQINLDPFLYTGIDASSIIIEKNRSKYQKENIIFKQGDIMSSEIPFVDLIIIKDVLQHLPNDFLPKIWDKINKKAKFIVITEDYIGGNTPLNGEIEIGHYRPLDLKSFGFNVTPILKYSDKLTGKQIWFYPPGAAHKISKSLENSHNINSNKKEHNNQKKNKYILYVLVFLFLCYYVLLMFINK